MGYWRLDDWGIEKVKYLAKCQKTICSRKLQVLVSFVWFINYFRPWPLTSPHHSGRFQFLLHIQGRLAMTFLMSNHEWNLQVFISMHMRIKVMKRLSFTRLFSFFLGVHFLSTLPQERIHTVCFTFRHEINLRKKTICFISNCITSL